MSKLNVNNPAYQLAEKKVPTIVKDIMENGTIGTEGERLIEQVAKAILKETYLFNTMGRQLRGKGARLNKLKYTTRKGWRQRAQKEWKEFGNHQTIAFLSENLTIKETLETSYGWSKYDLKDAKAGAEEINNILMSMLTEELPVEFEKRVLNGLRNATINGVELNNDQGGTINGVQVPNAFPKKVVVDTNYDDDDNVKKIINSMIGLSIRMGQQETPLTYRIKLSGKYEWLINPQLDAAIQRVGAYQSFSGDKAYERLLNNMPTKALNNIPVIISNELAEDQPFILRPKSGAFRNIEFIFTTLPTSFFTRADFEGSSASEMFFKSESDEFAINFSYWATRIGLWAAGVVDETKGIKFMNVHFKSSDFETGDTVGEYTITAPSSRTFNIYLIDMQTYSETKVVDSASIKVDGTATEISGMDNLAPGSYMLQIRETIDGVEWDIHTSATYYVRNAKYVPSKTGSDVNTKEQEEAVDVEAIVEARIEEEKAKLEAEFKAKLEEVQAKAQALVEEEETPKEEE